MSRRDRLDVRRRQRILRKCQQAGIAAEYTALLRCRWSGSWSEIRRIVCMVRAEVPRRERQVVK